MAASCPNRRRSKRIHPGGGRPGCPGQLEVHLAVPVVIRVKSMRGVSPESVLPAQPLRSGVRVPGTAVRAAFFDPALRDIVCPACGWSLKKAMAACRTKKGVR